MFELSKDEIKLYIIYDKLYVDYIGLELLILYQRANSRLGVADGLVSVYRVYTFRVYSLYFFNLNSIYTAVNFDE